MQARHVGRVPEDRLTIGMIGALPLSESMALPWIGSAALQPRRHPRPQGDPPLRHRADRALRHPHLRARMRAPARSPAATCRRRCSPARSPATRRSCSPRSRRAASMSARPSSSTASSSTLRASGGAVLLISEDLEEIFALSDRIAVMYGGRIIADIPAARSDGRARRPLHGRRGGGGMILRVWRGRASPARTRPAIAQHFKRSVVPELKSVDGFLGATADRSASPARRRSSSSCITRWRLDGGHRCGFAGNRRQPGPSSSRAPWRRSSGLRRLRLSL